MTRIALLTLLLILAGCGGDMVIECDTGPYLDAVETAKVQAPEGLDNLNPLAEMPLPSASPREPRPADGPCLEQPPQIIRIN